MGGFVIQKYLESADAELADLVASTMANAWAAVAVWCGRGDSVQVRTRPASRTIAITDLAVSAARRRYSSKEHAEMGRDRREKYRRLEKEEACC